MRQQLPCGCFVRRMSCTSQPGTDQVGYARLSRRDELKLLYKVLIEAIRIRTPTG